MIGWSLVIAIELSTWMPQDISTLYTVLIGVRKLDTIREQYGIAIIRGPIIADYARL